MMEMDQPDCDTKSTEVSSVLEKNTADSRNRIIYDFTTNSTLKNLYIDASGNVSIGKLFEDLDALAGNIAYTHVDDGVLSQK